jgi:hypothetical protein
VIAGVEELGVERQRQERGAGDVERLRRAEQVAGI